MINANRWVLRIFLGVLIVSVAAMASGARAQEQNGSTETISALETAFRASDLFTEEETINSTGKGGPKLSADGTSVTYAIDREDEDGIVSGYVYRRQLPSGSPEEVAIVGPGPDISTTPDGQITLIRTFPNSKNALYVSTVNGYELILEEDGGSEMTDAVIDGLGQRVFFTIRRTTNFVGVDGPNLPGLWTIDASAGNMRPVVLLDDLRDVIGAAPGDNVVSADPMTLAISDFTDNIVYTVSNVTTGESFVLAVSTNDGRVRLLHGPSEFVARATISGDGSTVFILDIATGDTTRTPRYTVVGFGGENSHELPAVVAGLSNNLNGLMLSLDGSTLLTSSAGLLMDTTDGFVRDLKPECLSQIPSSLFKPTMNSEGDKVVFLRQDAEGDTLVSIDILNEMLPYDQLTNFVTIEPRETVASNPNPTLVVAVGDIDQNAQVCMTLRDDLDLAISAVELRDDGENEDAAADDGVYTSEPLSVPAELPPGNLTVRIAVETASTDGSASTEVFDIPDGFTIGN